MDIPGKVGHVLNQALLVYKLKLNIFFYTGVAQTLITNIEIKKNQLMITLK